MGSARKNLNDDQKKEYSKLFENYFLKSFSSRLAVKIDWRVYTKNPDKPLIRDLIIEGLKFSKNSKRRVCINIKF